MDRAGTATPHRHGQGDVESGGGHPSESESSISDESETADEEEIPAEKKLLSIAVAIELAKYATDGDWIKGAVYSEEARETRWS